MVEQVPQRDLSALGKSGKYFCSGSSIESLPCSANSSTAAAVNTFLRRFDAEHGALLHGRPVLEIGKSVSAEETDLALFRNAGGQSCGSPLL